MEEIKYDFIAVEGIIGTGKTTFVEKLCADIGGTPVLEQFSENPFLPLFYEDPKRHAFTLETSFLTDRYTQMKEKLSTTQLFPPCVSDYILEKSSLFAQVNLTNQELHLFRKIVSLMMDSLPKPDLVFYLYKEPAKAKEQILMRGRPYEKNIEISYLESVQHAYMNFFKQNTLQKTVVVDTTNLDFVQNPSHYEYLQSLLRANYKSGITRIIPEFTHGN